MNMFTAPNNQLKAMQQEIADLKKQLQAAEKDAARFKTVANSAYQCADSRGPIWQIDVRVRDWNFIRDVDLVAKTEENL